MKLLPILLTTTLSIAVSARTDLLGCISSATTNQWHEASMIWYVPDTGEICDFPDCGGGRAPPKTTDPACPGYTGTATYEPSYLPGYGPGATATTTTVAATRTGDFEGMATVAQALAISTTTASTGSTSTPGKSQSEAATPVSSTGDVAAATHTPGSAAMVGYNVVGAVGVAGILGAVLAL